MFSIQSNSLKLFYRKSFISSNKQPEIPKDLISNIKPGHQILSNALDISKNTALISFGGSQSKFEKISWFIEVGLHKNRINENLNG